MNVFLNALGFLILLFFVEIILEIDSRDFAAGAWVLIVFFIFAYLLTMNLWIVIETRCLDGRLPLIIIATIIVIPFAIFVYHILPIFFKQLRHRAVPMLFLPLLRYIICIPHKIWCWFKRNS